MSTENKFCGYYFHGYGHFSCWTCLSHCWMNLWRWRNFGLNGILLGCHRIWIHGMAFRVRLIFLKDFQLFLDLSKRFWDTTCTFHFPGIGEVMLTHYDFSAITGLKLGVERIRVNDSISSVEIRGLLGVISPKSGLRMCLLMCLYSNIDKCETIATSTRMFMLLFIGTLLCPDLGSTVSLHYLWNLRDISQIKNYYWGGMAYATLLHFMT